MTCRKTAQSALNGRTLSCSVTLRLITAALCAAILFGLSLYVYSPLHHDDQVAGGPCPFCKLQNMSVETAPAAALVTHVASIVWDVALPAPLAHTCCFPRVQRGRAPPASFSAI